MSNVLASFLKVMRICCVFVFAMNFIFSVIFLINITTIQKNKILKDKNLSRLTIAFIGIAIASLIITIITICWFV